MQRPPDAEMRSPAARQSDRAKRSQNFSNDLTASAALEMQAARLRQRFPLLSHSFSRALSTIVWGALR